MQPIRFLLFLLFFILVPSNAAFSQNENSNSYNCFSVLIGKKATIDGSVMLAHNEDDGGDRIVNWYKVPKKKHLTKDSIQLKRGFKIPQVAKTNEYLWLEIPELEFSDSYFNEYGLVVASNNCRSREDQAELENGGIGYWLRRLMVERAKSAREAVLLAGNLIESIGYSASGRTYCIADSKETWMLSAVKGKHWVAQRIPDNQIAIIPNYYTITKVDLSDTKNFLGSKDLIEYAIKRGWYRPDEGNFNFRKAYSNQNNIQSITNKARHWVSINALSKKQYGIDDEFPFSFVPKKKLSLQDVFFVLRLHYKASEKTPFEVDVTKSPHHQKVMSICSNTNQYGLVAQLRTDMPSEIGNVLWLAPRRPCSQEFIPIYSGILNVPKKYSVYDEEKALINHFNKINNFKTYSKNQAYMRFDKKAKTVDTDYKKVIEKLDKKRIKRENKLLKRQKLVEKKFLKKWNKNPDKAKKCLTKYSKKALRKA